MDCASSIPDDGQIQDILVKKFQDERQILLHTVGVEVLSWDVRRSRVKSCNVAAELEFTKSQIDENANNFHAWSHRKWVLQTFGGAHTEKIWDEELDYCTEMVDKDPFNSLVWDHRYFVVTRCLLDHYDDNYDKKKARKVDHLFWKLRDIEVDYAIEVIKGSGAGNRCPWSYFRSLFTVFFGPMALNRSVTSVVLWVLDKSKSTLKDLDGMEERSILNALNMLLDLLSHGYEIDKDEVGNQILLALEALKPDCGPAQFRSTYKVLVVLEKELTASGLVWRNAVSEFLDGTLLSFQRKFKLRFKKNGGKKWLQKVFVHQLLRCQPKRMKRTMLVSLAIGETQSKFGETRSKFGETRSKLGETHKRCTARRSLYCGEVIFNLFGLMS